MTITLISFLTATITPTCCPPLSWKVTATQTVTATPTRTAIPDCGKLGGHLWPTPQTEGAFTISGSTPYICWDYNIYGGMSYPEYSTSPPKTYIERCERCGLWREKR